MVARPVHHTITNFKKATPSLSCIVLQALELEIYCWCHLPDEGTMVECLRWFHFHCVKPSEKLTEGWDHGIAETVIS